MSKLPHVLDKHVGLVGAAAAAGLSALESTAVAARDGPEEHRVLGCRDKLRVRGPIVARATAGRGKKKKKKRFVKRFVLFRFASGTVN